jgi:hypothetical protein
MNPDDSFYQFARRPDLSEPSQSFTFRTRDAEAGGGGGGGRARAATPTHPFKLTDATASGVAKVKVAFGMVNAITPTSMDPADGLTLTVGSSGYVVLAVTTNASGIATSAAISITASVAADTATVGRVALGYVTSNSSPLSVTCSQSVSNSLRHQQCGTTTHLFGRV